MAVLMVVAAGMVAPGDRHPLSVLELAVITVVAAGTVELDAHHPPLMSAQLADASAVLPD
ncbi:MAG: hypothetical protein WA876_10130 [Candidatus Acidiferrales bacterium]